MEFDIKLKQLRKGHQMSQEELAGQLNVSRQAVSKWESGQGFPETDKLLMISSIFGVSLDYLLKDDNEGYDSGKETGYYASKEMVYGYLDMKKRGAAHIAAAVSVMILSVSFTMLFEDAAGTFLFFLCAAAGTAMLVLQGFRHKRYEEAEKQPLIFDESFIREFRNRYISERKRCGMYIAAGIVIIMLSYPLNVLIEDILNLPAQYEALYPVLWALGTAVLIVNSSAVISGDVIADNKKYIEEMTQEKKFSWIFGTGFSSAAAIFIAAGVLADKWHPGWAVFPAAALLCTAVSIWMKSKQ